MIRLIFLSLFLLFNIILSIITANVIYDGPIYNFIYRDNILLRFLFIIIFMFTTGFIAYFILKNNIVIIKALIEGDEDIIEVKFIPKQIKQAILKIHSVGLLNNLLVILSAFLPFYLINFQINLFEYNLTFTFTIQAFLLSLFYIHMINEAIIVNILLNVAAQKR